jgi:hypothetical protein
MIRTLKQMTAVAGIAVAVVAAGPISSAFAATGTPSGLPTSTLSTYTVPTPPSFTLPIPLPLPGQPTQSGTCPANQGLPAGVVNLGPTGPLGPLGPNGPLGAGHLPCGASIWDLGPGGPLGPGGALGPGALFPGSPSRHGRSQRGSNRYRRLAIGSR